MTQETFKKAVELHRTILTIEESLEDVKNSKPLFVCARLDNGNLEPIAPLLDGDLIIKKLEEDLENFKKQFEEL